MEFISEIYMHIYMSEFSGHHSYFIQDFKMRKQHRIANTISTLCTRSYNYETTIQTICLYLSSMAPYLTQMTSQNPNQIRASNPRCSPSNLWHGPWNLSTLLTLWHIRLHLVGWINALDHEKVASRPIPPSPLLLSSTSSSTFSFPPPPHLPPPPLMPLLNFYLDSVTSFALKRGPYYLFIKKLKKLTTMLGRCDLQSYILWHFSVYWH